MDYINLNSSLSTLSLTESVFFNALANAAMKEGFTKFLSAMLPRMMELPGEISVYGLSLIHI